MASGWLRAVLTLSLASLAALALALKVGSVPVGWADVGRALGSAPASLPDTLIQRIRLPRALTAYATGGLLALAGVYMQALLRNSLADPYVLGVSGGAAVASLSAVLLGLSAVAQDAATGIGAVAALGLVLALSDRRGPWRPERLLLTGIVTATAWSALLGLLLTVAAERETQGFLFWLMGRVRDDRAALPPLLILLAITLAGLVLARHLDALARPDAEARALGVRVAGLRLTVLVLASLATAAAVTLAGPVGFVGLLAPHLLRLAGILNQRLLLLTAPLLGGTLLLLADTLARTVAAPRELPVGVLTAALGAPLLLTLLHRPRDPRTRSFPTPATPAAPPTPTPACPGLTVRGLTLQRGTRSLCRNAHFRILPGECWAVLGPNGAGKTTLLHALAGLMPPQAGGVCLGERPVANWAPAERARCLGLLFQETEERLPVPVFDRALMGRYPHRPFWQGPTAQDRRRAWAALRTTELETLAHRAATTLSGGERRRLAWAALLTQAPGLYLLDEPTAHLDLRHRIALLQDLRERLGNHGAAVLVLHDVNLAVRFCTHALLLWGNGRWLAGPAEDVLTAPRLSDLYGHPLTEVDTPRGRSFLPC